MTGADRFARGTLILVLALAVSCGRPPAEPARAPASDPVAVAVELESARVRVLRATLGPGGSASPRAHPDRVAVFLTGADLEIENPDGSASRERFESGEVRFRPAGTHVLRNAGDRPVEMLLVELKPSVAGPEPGAPPPGGADPTTVDADRYAAEIENDRVRVLRVRYGAGETSAMHFHPDSVGVFLTEQHVRLERPDGNVREVRVEAGGFLFVPAGSHRITNPGDAPFEAVSIELKRSEGTPPVAGHR